MLARDARPDAGMCASQLWLFGEDCVVEHRCSRSDSVDRDRDVLRCKFQNSARLHQLTKSHASAVNGSVSMILRSSSSQSATARHYGKTSVNEIPVACERFRWKCSPPDLKAWRYAIPPATSIPETLVRTHCYGDSDPPISSGRMRCHPPLQSAVTYRRNAERGLTYAPHGQLHESFGRYEAPK